MKVRLAQGLVHALGRIYVTMLLHDWLALFVFVQLSHSLNEAVGKHHGVMSFVVSGTDHCPLFIHRV